MTFTANLPLFATLAIASAITTTVTYLAACGTMVLIKNRTLWFNPKHHAYLSHKAHAFAASTAVTATAWILGLI